MKRIVILCCLCIIILGAVFGPEESFASVSGGWGPCDSEWIPSESINTLITTLQSKFPVNILVKSIEILSEFNSITPESPSNFELNLGYLVLHPFTFFESGVMDSVFLLIRICFLGMLIVSAGRQVIESVL